MLLCVVYNTNTVKNIVTTIMEHTRTALEKSSLVTDAKLWFCCRCVVIIALCPLNLALSLSLFATKKKACFSRIQLPPPPNTFTTRNVTICNEKEKTCHCGKPLPYHQYNDTLHPTLSSASFVFLQKSQHRTPIRQDTQEKKK